MTKNIITSVGIQKRFHKIAVKLMKRRLYSKEYWLLDENENSEGLLNAPKNRISSENNRIVSEENQIVSEESAIERKVNKNIYRVSQTPHYFTDNNLEQAFLMYINCRKANGDVLTNEQILLLKDELGNLTENIDEQIAIVKKATMSNWKSFYPLKKEKKQISKAKGSRFSNFEQRKYDYDNLERQILKKNRGNCNE